MEHGVAQRRAQPAEQRSQRQRRALVVPLGGQQHHEQRGADRREQGHREHAAVPPGEVADHAAEQPAGHPADGGARDVEAHGGAQVAATDLLREVRRGDRGEAGDRHALDQAEDDEHAEHRDPRQQQPQHLGHQQRPDHDAAAADDLGERAERDGRHRQAQRRGRHQQRHRAGCQPELLGELRQHRLRRVEQGEQRQRAEQQGDADAGGACLVVHAPDGEQS